MTIRLQTYSFRFAEQVLNSQLAIKQEIEQILTDPSINISELSRPKFNEILDQLFQAKGWTAQPAVFEEPSDTSARMDFMKDRVGVEVEFGHASFIGIDLLKFQVSSYSGPWGSVSISREFLRASPSVQAPKPASISKTIHLHFPESLCSLQNFMLFPGQSWLSM